MSEQDFRYDKDRKTLIPARPGYYWALWTKAADGTHEGDDLTPAVTWEIVQVNDNNVDDPEDDEYLSVSVPGVRETQWRENFSWGARVCGLEKREPHPVAQQVRPSEFAVASAEAIKEAIRGAPAGATTQIGNSAALALAEAVLALNTTKSHAETSRGQNQLSRGDLVSKVGGDYRFDGIVVAAFEKLSGGVRYVVEDDRGVLHIFSAKNLHDRHEHDASQTAGRSE